MAGAADIPEVEGIDGLHVVGQGGFATVYRGRQSAFHRDVAVKVLQRSGLDSDDRRRFERECQAMGALSNHPAIVTLYDAGFTADERPYLVMAFVPDGSLQDRLTAGPMGWQEATVVGIQLAGALEAAHRAGVIHRDIKPGNVLRSEYGTQLGDFGIARLQGGHETRSGVITASIAHAAPEILDGDPPGVRSDVYSLGSTLYEALRGKAAFSRVGDEGLIPMIRRVMTDPVPDLREHGVPDEIGVVVQKAMAKNPAERYESAEDFGCALQHAQVSLGVNVTDLLIVGARRSGETATLLVSRPDESSPSSERDESKTVARPVTTEGTPPVAPPSTPEPPVVVGAPTQHARSTEFPPAAPVLPPQGHERRSGRWIVPALLGGVVALLVAIVVLWPRDSPETAGPGATVGSEGSTAPNSAVTGDTVVAGESTEPPDSVTVPPDIRFDGPIGAAIVAQAEIGADAVVDGMTFTAIDGIAYDPIREQLLAVKEPAPSAVRGANPSLADPAVFAIPFDFRAGSTDLGAALDLSSATAEPLLGRDGSPYGLELDVEGMTVVGDGDFFVVSEGSGEGDSEGGPFVHRFGSDGRFLAELQLPPWYLSDAAGTTGFTPSRGLHGIAERPGHPDEVVAIVEAPLIQDHDPDRITEPKVTRLIAFDVSTGEPTAEWGYPLDLISAAAAAGQSDPRSLVIDMTMLDDNSLVVLESTWTTEGQQLNMYRVELDEGSVPGPTSPAPITKSLIELTGESTVGLLTDYRSISRGPTLGDGRSSLILTTDNGFADEATQVLVLGVNVPE